MTVVTFPPRLAVKPWQTLVADLHDLIRRADGRDEAEALYVWLREAEKDVLALTTLAGAKLLELETKA